MVFQIYRKTRLRFAAGKRLEGFAMVRRYGLRDDQWERIKALLPGREETVGVTAKDNRLFVEAV